MKSQTTYLIFYWLYFITILVFLNRSSSAQEPPSNPTPTKPLTLDVKLEDVEFYESLQLFRDPPTGFQSDVKAGFDSLEQVLSYAQKRQFTKSREKAESEAAAEAKTEFPQISGNTVLIRIVLPETETTSGNIVSLGTATVEVAGTGKSVMQAYMPGYLERYNHGTVDVSPAGVIIYYVAFRREAIGHGDVLFPQTLDSIAGELVGNTAECKQIDVLTAAVNKAVTQAEENYQRYILLQKAFDGQNQVINEMRKQLDQYLKAQPAPKSSSSPHPSPSEGSTPQHEPIGAIHGGHADAGSGPGPAPSPEAKPQPEKPSSPPVQPTQPSTYPLNFNS